jgi:hypothetical protein
MDNQTLYTYMQESFLLLHTSTSSPSNLFEGKKEPYVTFSNRANLFNELELELEKLDISAVLEIRTLVETPSEVREVAPSPQAGQ